MPPRDRQDRLHRLDRGRAYDPRSDRWQRQASHPQLGGKSPFIVFDDADLDSAVEGVVDAIWFNQGQVCCAGSRLLLHESIAEAVHDKLRARMERLRVGDPLDKSIDIGAIVAPVQLDRIEALVQQGIDEGGTHWQPSWACPTEGYFYPPTLFTDVAPAATIARVEIFGPVLVSMSFRTPAEAVALANDTRYGLAASVWTENVNLALDVAPKLACGVVWINSTNLFDAASGFGGVRESGFGREGGREGLREYLRPVWESTLRATTRPTTPALKIAARGSEGALDRTAKQYIGGRQVRPDSGYSRTVLAPDGALIAEVGEGNRKDIRDAVEAAVRAAAWGRAAAHGRAQVLYFVAENLEARANEFRDRLRAMTGVTKRAADKEMAASVRRLMTYAAWADKFDGAVHTPVAGQVILAMHEPTGVIGIACPDESPLLAFVSLVAPAVAMGNRGVAVPSEHHPLSATDFYQVLDTSDVPAGTINIVTGERGVLAQVMAEHDGLDAVSAPARAARRSNAPRPATSSVPGSTTAGPATGTNPRKEKGTNS